MKFELRHTFAVPPEVLWQALLDPAMEQKMTEMSQSKREVIEERVDGPRVFRRVRLHTSNPAFATVAKLLGSSSVSFDHETTSDATDRSVEWRFVPPPGLTQLRIGGRFVVLPHAEGSERVATGEVEVRVPMVGKTIEGRIIDAIKAMYDRGAAIRRDAFARSAPPTP